MLVDLSRAVSLAVALRWESFASLLPSGVVLCWTLLVASGVRPLAVKMILPRRLRLAGPTAGLSLAGPAARWGRPGLLRFDCEGPDVTRELAPRLSARSVALS